jgi:hypothetical protein
MEAPVKSGGTRKQPDRRDLIGRLSTLPPIEFLKRHNPLRRREKIKLGFDQPRHEIEELAIPLRTAPPALRRRVQLWLGRLWCRSAVVAGRLSAKAERAKVRVSNVAARYAKGLTTSTCATWEPAQAPTLMVRTQQVRSSVVGLAICQWSMLVGLCVVLNVLTLEEKTWDNRTVNLCGLAILTLSLIGLVLQAWYQRLVASWRSLDLFTCGQCGELRNFAPSRPCPCCGSDAVPVFPGQVPVSWTKQLLALSALLLASPAILVGMLLLSTRIM